MKKILALLMAMALILSSLPAFAEEDKEQAEHVTVADAIPADTLQLMKYFEIMDCSKNADTEVTRADFAVNLARLLNINEYAVNSTVYYPDMPQDHWAAESVNRLAELGAFAMGADVNFRPNDAITVIEATKAVLSIMGYQTYADMNGGYPQGYYKAAENLKLLKGINVNGNLTMADAAKLFANAMEAEVFGVSISSSLVWEKIEGKTLLSLYRNIYIAEGVVEAIGHTALYAGDEIADGTIKINGITYDFDGGNEMIGMRVKAYYEQVRDEDPKVLLMTAKNREKDILEITGKEFINFSNDYVLEYYKDGNESRKTSVNIPVDAAIICNGLAVTENAVAKVNIEEGKIRYIKGQGDIKDVLVVWSAETMNVGHIDSEKSIIYNTDNTVAPLDLGDDSLKVRFYDAYGEPTDISTIGINSVLTIYRGEDICVDIYISQEKISGIYEGAEYENGNRYLIISGERYKVIESYYATISRYLTINKEFTFFLDIFGNITNITVAAEDTQYVYGYYISHKTVELDEEVIRMRIYSEAEGLTNFYLAEKVTIDGLKVKEIAAIDARFTDCFARAQIEYSKFMQRPTSVKSRLIRYKTNKEGEITHIDTPYTDAGHEAENDALFIDDAISDTVVLGRDSQSIRIDDGLAIVGYKMVNDTTTLVITAPNDRELENANAKMFDIERDGGALGRSKNFIGYKTSKEHGVNDVIVIISNLTTTMYADNNVLVSKIGWSLDEDGTPVEYVEGYQGTTPVKINMTPDAIDWQGRRIDLSSSGISRGDIITLVIDSSGEASEYFLAYDASENQCYNPPNVSENGVTIISPKSGRIMFTNLAKDDTMNFYDTFYNRGTMTAGYVKNIKENVIGISFEPMGDVVIAYPASGKQVMIYDDDLDRDGFYAGSMEDIVSFEEAGSNCSKIVAVHSYAEWLYYYIYK